MTGAPRTIDDYLQLPYQVTVVHDRSEHGLEGYVATVAELRGCIAQGATEDEARREIREAMRVWLETAIEKGYAIPTPGEEGTT